MQLNRMCFFDAHVSSMRRACATRFFLLATLEGTEDIAVLDPDHWRLVAWLRLTGLRRLAQMALGELPSLAKKHREIMRIHACPSKIYGNYMETSGCS